MTALSHRHLVVVFVLFLAGCAGQKAQHSVQQEQGLVFSVASAAYRLAPGCTSRTEVVHDEEGRPFIDVSMKLGSECSEKAFDAVFAKTGQRLTVTYAGQVLVDSALIVTPIDPAGAFRVGAHSDDQAREIVNALTAPNQP